MDKLEQVLTRGVAQILPSKKALATQMAKKKITLYQGFDPSSPHLHLGNLIGIRKLAQFQKLGHKVIFLIGDFTGMIGDPTDKSAARKKMSRKQVLENAKDYKKQIERVLKFTGPNAAEIKFNSEWLSKLTFKEVVELASNFTAQQMLERDFFQERLTKSRPIFLHEFLYPLMQAYDCVHMNVDLEIGGNDQLFNIIAGRTLMKAVKGKEKYVLTMKLLEDATGQKMGKTEGNTINLTDTPSDIFGKIMALPDTLIEPAIELLTNLYPERIKKDKPMALKKLLASDVVKQVYGTHAAQKAKLAFEKTFQQRKPDYENELVYKKTLREIVALGANVSMSQAKRLIIQGAVKVNNKIISDPTFKLKGGEKIKIGKITFVKVEKK